MEIPCKDCITLPICLTKYKKNIFTFIFNIDCKLIEEYYMCENSKKIKDFNTAKIEFFNKVISIGEFYIERLNKDNITIEDLNKLINCKKIKVKNQL